MPNFPKRKIIRYRGYDYSSQGSYFVTISTYQRKNLFWENNSLNKFGKIVENHILNLCTHYYGIKIDKVIYNNKYYSFMYNGFVYRLYIYEDSGDIKQLYEINKKLIGNTLMSEIVVNRNNEIISNYNGIS